MLCVSVHLKPKMYGLYKKTRLFKVIISLKALFLIFVRILSMKTQREIWNIREAR